MAPGAAVSGRGLGLEAWIKAQLAHPGVSHWKKLHAETRGSRGKLLPTGTAPPDFLIILRDGPALYLEAKEGADPRFGLARIEEHQARDLDALPGSVVVIRFLAVPRSTTVVVPWAALSRRWHEHHDSRQRAIKGTASLSPAEARALGVDVSGACGLVEALRQLAKDERRRGAA